VEADVDGLSFVTARGWEDLSNLMETYEALGIPVTEEVVQQFLHHQEIAEDAAAYFTLYRKYEDDYQIDRILAGQVPSYIYARLEEAGFDERLSVVNLVLQGLTNLLDRYGEEKEKADSWYGFLKNYRQQVMEAENPAACYMAQIKEMEERLNQEIQAEILTREEISRKKHLLKSLTEAASSIESGATSREAFEAVRVPFMKQTEKLEQIEKKTLQAMENAFTFIENAFESGQELVIFVTQLTITPNAAVFLSEHSVSRYEAYKEQLLIGTRKAALLEELTK
jgi:arginine repressor